MGFRGTAPMAREYPLQRYRNFGIMAHIDAGKTTCTERILYYTGKSHNIDEVHDGAATMDWMEQEQERGITITSAATTTFWQWQEDPTKEGTSDTKYRMNIIGADFFNCVEMIADRTGAIPTPIQIPIGAESALEGMIDLITMEEWVWKGEDLGASWVRQPIRDELKATADEWRGKLIENAVEMDDDAMMAYLEGEEPDIATLRKLIRKGTLALAFVPVLCGSAFKNKGVQPLLNAVIDFLPSPLDVVDYMGFKPGDEEEIRNIARRADDAMPFAGLAFKIMNDPFVGSLTFVRIYSGKLAKGDTMLNSTKGKKERIGRMMMMHSNNREEIEEA